MPIQKLFKTSFLGKEMYLQIGLWVIGILKIVKMKIKNISGRKTEKGEAK